MTLRLLSLAMLCQLLVSFAEATTPVIIEIESSDGVPSYRLNNRPLTSESLKTWMTDTITRFGDNGQVIIRPASNVSLASLFDVLQVLSLSGVGEIKVSVSHDDDGKIETSRYIKVNGAQVIEERGPSPKTFTSNNTSEVLDKELKRILDFTTQREQHDTNR